MASGKTKQASKSLRGSKPQMSISKSVAAGFEHHDWVNMLIDPIGAPAAQVPDMWPYPTQAMKLKQVSDVLTNADGDAVVTIGNTLTTGFLRVYAPTVGTRAFTVTNASSAHVDYTAFAAAFDRSRTTCAGLKFTAFLTPETEQGMCGFLQMPEESIPGYVGLTIPTMLADGESAPVSEGCTTVVYPMEEPTFSTTHTYWTYMPQTFLIIKGAKPSTVIGQLESYWNVEGVSDPSSVHAGASSVEPYDPVAHTIGANVTQSAAAARTASGKYAPRRLTAHGRAIADASAAALGYGMGGATGALVANAPATIRESKKRLKKLLQAMSN